jgi:hypothetical protein
MIQHRGGIWGQGQCCAPMFVLEFGGKGIAAVQCLLFLLWNSAPSSPPRSPSLSTYRDR